MVVWLLRAACLLAKGRCPQCWCVRTPAECPEISSAGGGFAQGDKCGCAGGGVDATRAQGIETDTWLTVCPRSQAMTLHFMLYVRCARAPDLCTLKSDGGASWVAAGMVQETAANATNRHPSRTKISPRTLTASLRPLWTPPPHIPSQTPPVHPRANAKSRVGTRLDPPLTPAVPPFTRAHGNLSSRSTHTFT